ncbi:MAG TPA: carboxypeptidase regulatory-like domain-containing protein, partial [Thermoanaerobaculia bacterium]
MDVCRPALLAASLCLGLATPLDGATAAAAQGLETEISAGMPLTDALAALRKKGLRLVYSSLIVRADMRVVIAPASGEPRAMLEELLAPHGLAVREEQGGSLVIVSLGGEDARAVLGGTVRARGALTPLRGVTVTVPSAGASAVTGADGRFLLGGLEPGERTVRAGRSGFAIEERSGIRLFPGRTTELAIELSPVPAMAEEIVVNPSRISVLQEEPVAPLSLSREQMLRLPQLGGDVFRTLSLLPGIAADDVAAQFHIRGGRRDEVLVLLDGQELYEAYHLKDFDNALSVVAATGLSRLDLTTGAFPSSYGDRMGGILDLSTMHPSRARRFRLSLSVLTAQLEGSGSLGDRLWLLGSLRRGT